MANLALQLRLGIRRGWRVKMFNDIGLYTPSLLHCMFLFTILRVKALRLRMWVVGYYLVFSLSRLNIYAFFWALPKSARVLTIFRSDCRFKFRTIRSFRPRNLAPKVLLNVVPTKFIWRQFGFANFKLLGENASRFHPNFGKLWDFGGSLIRFLLMRTKTSYTAACFSTLAAKDRAAAVGVR